MMQQMPSQPPQKQETVNLTPVYAFLTVIAVLVGIALILAGTTNGAVGGLVEAKHHADPVNVIIAAGNNETTACPPAKVEKTKTPFPVYKDGIKDVPASQRPPSGDNPCMAKKPKSGFENTACAEDAINEQAAADVSSPFIGTKQTNAEPILKPYWQAGICPVNVHWHKGAEHRSAGQYDQTSAGPNGEATGEGSPRQGLRCKKYNDKDAMFNTEYDWKFCKHMHVGETYEVHWPHSGAGACGTINQYQTPFYDGVFCTDDVITSTNKQIGVQAQVFTIVNDEAYYYPDLIRGMIVDGKKGEDVVFYTGSTTGDSRSNTICSQYAPITWQVDRTCHLISASSFDKMCADMKAQRDDMTDDLHPHGSREVVSASLTANNMVAGSLSHPFTAP